MRLPEGERQKWWRNSLRVGLNPRVAIARGFFHSGLRCALVPFFKRDREPSGPNALIASAANMGTPTRGGGSNSSPKQEKWQEEAWAMYHTLGEFRQGVNWLANVISRIRLVAAVAPRRPGEEPEPIDPDTNDPAVDLVQDIALGIGGQSELLRSAATHLTVGGEGWFVGRTSPDHADERSWKFYSAKEVRTRAVGGVELVEIQVGPGAWEPLPLESLPVRIWKPDDQFHWEADSSTRAALPIMRRLELLNRRVDANSTSRLTTNGVYWVASEIVFPVSDDSEEDDDPFVSEFIDVGMKAISTPGSPAAAMPMIVRAPGQWIKDGIRYDTFADPSDANLREDREFEVRRLATALDVPPEVLLGMAGVNHWTGWQVEESALKTTVTTLVELICWALTTHYLQPALRSLHGDDAPATRDDEGYEINRIVWYDLSELSVRPDRSQDALTLNERLIINDEATLRETGFDETDRLTDEAELKRKIGLSLALSPSTALIGLELLGIEVKAGVVDPLAGPPAAVPGPTPEPTAADTRQPPPTINEPPPPPDESVPPGA